MVIHDLQDSRQADSRSYANYSQGTRSTNCRSCCLLLLTPASHDPNVAVNRVSCLLQYRHLYSSRSYTLVAVFPDIVEIPFSLNVDLLWCGSDEFCFVLPDKLQSLRGRELDRVFHHGSVRLPFGSRRLLPTLQECRVPSPNSTKHCLGQPCRPNLRRPTSPHRSAVFASNPHVLLARLNRRVAQPFRREAV